MKKSILILSLVVFLIVGVRYVLGAESKTVSYLSGEPYFGTSVNYSKFEADGTYVMIGSSTVWNDTIISATNLRPGASDPDFNVLVGGIYALSFANGSTDIVYGSFEMPHDYKEGSTIDIHAHWSPSTTNTDNCVFKFEYSIVSRGTGAFTTTASTTLTQAGSGTVNQHQYVEGAATIDGTTIKIGDVIQFAFSRPAGDAFTGDAFLHSIGIHYQSDTIGSRQKIIK